MHYRYMRKGISFFNILFLKDYTIALTIDDNYEQNSFPMLWL